MKSEKISVRRETMVVLDVCLDNFYAFKNFHMNLTYPKKIVDSCIQDEYLEGRPNFRYKKVNIIMGANASGKTTLGFMLRGIFNFISNKYHGNIVKVIHDRTREASFTIDLVCQSNILYRVACTVRPKPDGNYDTKDIELSVCKETIWAKDSYESCVKRLEAGAASYVPCKSYLDELDKIEEFGWLFEYPRDTQRTLQLSPEDEKFPLVLENILKALDPSIRTVKKSNDVDDAYVVWLQDEAVILQNKATFDTERLSSGTKTGVEIARVVSAVLQGLHTFYYCDEKFSYIHSDIERAVLSVMIDCIRPNEQLFFTTHNTDLLDMNLPKHAFTFLRKDPNDEEHPISCVSASDFLKRSSDSLKNAVANDLFSTAPAVELIYEIADL